MNRWGWCAMGAALVASATAVARADGAHDAANKQACHAAYDATQKLRREGKLGAAREQAVLCARDVCSELARNDCTKWVEEIRRATPTVVFEVRDASGAETTAATVLLDGQPWIDKIDGKARELDPGEHTLRFQIAGAPPRDEKVVIREGEKDRKLAVTFAAGPPADAATKSEPDAPAPSPSGRVPTWAWVSGGAGAALVVVGVVFAIDATSASSRLSSQCTPSFAHCDATLKDGGSKSDVVSQKNTALVLTGVLGGVGVVGLGVGGYGFFFARKKADAPATGAELVPTIGGAALRARF